jgi:hypothetical protein
MPQCPSCEEKFSHQDALCEDWRDTKRSFGCPHCGLFFHQVSKATPRALQRFEQNKFVILLVFVMSPSSYLFVNFLQKDEMWLAGLSIVPLIAVSAISVIEQMTSKSSLEPSGHKVHIEKPKK